MVGLGTSESTVLSHLGLDERDIRERKRDENVVSVSAPLGRQTRTRVGESVVSGKDLMGELELGLTREERELMGEVEPGDLRG